MIYKHGWIFVIFTLLFLIGCQQESESTEKNRKESANKLTKEDNTRASNPQDGKKTTNKLPDMELLVTNTQGDYVSFINPSKGSIEKLQVGTAPFGIALTSDNRAYVSTAEGIAIIDTKRRKLIKRVPYKSDIDEVDYGEYREGGMGITISPDGRYVYVGIYLHGGQDKLGVLDTTSHEIIKSIPIGVRPFDVLVSKDGSEVYSIDHDSFSVTVVDPVNGSTKTIDITPLGRGGFNKPHYATIVDNGHLFLPYQGKVLVDLDPTTGKYTTKPLTANTHQHGVTITPDGNKLLIAGTGSAGNATEGPKLSIVDLGTMKAKHIPLDKPHENVTVTKNGQTAILTGGFTYANQGWDGLTFVNLKTNEKKTIKVEDRPLDVKIIN